MDCKGRRETGKEHKPEFDLAINGQIKSDITILSDPNNKYMKLSVYPGIKGALSLERFETGGYMPSDPVSIEDYVSEFRQCIRCISNMMEKGENAGTIHVFMSAPGEMFSFLMPYFVNKKNVMMYRFIKKDENTGRDAFYVPMGKVEER